MDEQGVSSIVTLQEMGFTEVRLRDTLMRATNATGLFSDAQQTATSAWQENVALSNEAGKRYATMTGAQARWNEFAQNPGAITTEAIITGYGQQDGVEPPKLETVITISGYDLTAYRQFMADNPIEVEGVLRLSEVFSNPEDALTAENVDFWQNDVEIPASLVPKELLTPDKVAVLDADGTIHILITPKIEGTAEAVSAAGEKLDERFVTTFIFGKNSQHDWGALNSVLGGSLIDWIANQIEFSKILCNHENRTFTVSFRCKPFWYQENVPEITLTTSGTFVTNPGNVYAEPVITVYGAGEITLMVGMTIVELDSNTDSITLDTPLMEAYNGVTSMNGCISGDFPTLTPGANAVSWTGNVTKVVIQPNWRYL